MDDNQASRNIQNEIRRRADVGSPLTRAFMTARDASLFLSVLRNYEDLPEKPGRDIDIFVYQEELERVAEIFRKCYSEAGWLIISDWTRSHVRSISMVKQAGTETAGFTVDLVARIQWRGIDIADPNTIHNVTTPRTNILFQHVTLGADAALRLQKLILRGEAETLAKIGMIRSMVLADIDGFNQVMSDMLSQGDLEVVRSSILDGEEPSTLMHEFERIRSRLVRKSLASRPLLPITWARLAANLLYVPKSRRGKVIAFVGPDGSGKTTMINRTELLMRNHGPRKTKRYYGRVPLFPRLGSVKSLLKPSLEETDFTAKHSGSRVKAHSRKRIASYFLYYGLEGAIARLVLFFQKRRGKVVLFDRFAYDFAVQPAYIQVPQPWLKALLWVLPKPDIVCFLYCDPATIYARKPELRQESIIEQQHRFRELFATFGRRPTVFELDTSSFDRKDFINFLNLTSIGWDKNGTTSAARLPLTVVAKDTER